MERTLSIRSTALVKFALPPIWISVVALAIRQLWVTPDMVSPLTRWLLLALLAASLAILFAFVVPLKRVDLTAEGLRVSNFRRQATVPFSAITGVRQNWLPTFRLVTLELRGDTPMGRRVIFMPAGSQRAAFWRAEYWREDSVVGELRRLAGLTTDTGSPIAV